MALYADVGRRSIFAASASSRNVAEKAEPPGWFPCVENARRRLAQINSITRLPGPVFCREKPLFSSFLRFERHVLFESEVGFHSRWHHTHLNARFHNLQSRITHMRRLS